MAVAWHVNIRMMSIALPESILAINAPANISSGIAPSGVAVFYWRQRADELEELPRELLTSKQMT